MRIKYLAAGALLFFAFPSFAQEELNQPDFPGELMIDIGLNYLDDEPLTIDQSGWSSKSVSFYYTKRKQFGRKFAINGGLGFGLEKLSLGDTTTLFSQYLNGSDVEAVAVVALPGTGSDDDPILSYNKNRLAVTYFEAPIDFRFYPKGTEEGEGIFLGVGGMFGLRLNSKTKWKYDRFGETVIEKTSGKFNLNSVRYGFQARLGFKGVHLFYKQYMSDLFKDEVGGVNPRMTTVGINVTGF
ncbi:MAG: outer membrane beta-barrel protein [Ekhidna sp.]|nr:outer membrane beta-barrel protein [Ekhidna sp.]